MKKDTIDYKKESEIISMFLFGKISIVLEDRDNDFYKWYVNNMREKYNLC